MNHETLTYQADGLTMESQLFFEPSSTPRAGVLVFPEVFGLGEHAVSRARRNMSARRFYEAHGFLAVRKTDGDDNEEREPDVRRVSLSRCRSQACCRGNTRVGDESGFARQSNSVGNPGSR